ncbi:hypothetical protein BDP27DRAFT_1493516 [Rhodocollybia butyracea]|uniref:Uncharacterized protein n=1 Tax=Rhodocollybia butyracea TaxID=206335 RepID=A0A9P5PBL5_9AGAR|nr:hypothetical protein BDP27DRAFT_1493516 [Rhodocollybia butyracea]
MARASSKRLKESASAKPDGPALSRAVETIEHTRLKSSLAMKLESTVLETKLIQQPIQISTLANQSPQVVVRNGGTEWYTLLLGTKIDSARAAYNILNAEMADFGKQQFTTEKEPTDWGDKFFTKIKATIKLCGASRSRTHLGKRHRHTNITFPLTIKSMVISAGQWQWTPPLLHDSPTFFLSTLSHPVAISDNTQVLHYLSHFLDQPQGQENGSMRGPEQGICYQKLNSLRSVLVEPRRYTQIPRVTGVQPMETRPSVESQSLRVTTEAMTLSIKLQSRYNWKTGLPATRERANGVASKTYEPDLKGCGARGGLGNVFDGGAALNRADRAVAGGGKSTAPTRVLVVRAAVTTASLNCMMSGPDTRARYGIEPTTRDKHPQFWRAVHLVSQIYRCKSPRWSPMEIHCQSIVNAAAITHSQAGRWVTSNKSQRVSIPLLHPGATKDSVYSTLNYHLGDNLLKMALGCAATVQNKQPDSFHYLSSQNPPLFASPNPKAIQFLLNYLGTYQAVWNESAQQLPATAVNRLRTFALVIPGFDVPAAAIDVGFRSGKHLRHSIDNHSIHALSVYALALIPIPILICLHTSIITIPAAPILPRVTRTLSQERPLPSPSTFKVSPTEQGSSSPLAGFVIADTFDDFAHAYKINNDMLYILQFPFSVHVIAFGIYAYCTHPRIPRTARTSDPQPLSNPNVSHLTSSISHLPNSTTGTQTHTPPTVASLIHLANNLHAQKTLATQCLNRDLPTLEALEACKQAPKCICKIGFKHRVTTPLVTGKAQSKESRSGLASTTELDMEYGLGLEGFDATDEPGGGGVGMGSTILRDDAVTVEFTKFLIVDR